MWIAFQYCIVPGFLSTINQTPGNLSPKNPVPTVVPDGGRTGNTMNVSPLSSMPCMQATSQTPSLTAKSRHIKKSTGTRSIYSERLPTTATRIRSRVLMVGWS
ncbi:unnamed protein product [Ectocarpus sp. 13 AM-2016]